MVTIHGGKGRAYDKLTAKFYILLNIILLEIMRCPLDDFLTFFIMSKKAHSLAPSSIVAMWSWRSWEHSLRESPMATLNSEGGCKYN